MSDNNLNRRSVLRGIGAATLSAPVIGNVAAQKERNGLIISELREPNDAISSSHLRELQEQAASRHRSLQSSNELVPIGGPRIENSEGKVVSYAVKIFPNGTSRYHANIVRDESMKADRLHSETNQFIEEYQNKTQVGRPVRNGRSE